jgi:hypothetical protein
LRANRNEAPPAAPPLTLRSSPLIHASFGFTPKENGHDEVLLFWEPAAAAPTERSRPRRPARVTFRVYEIDEALLSGGEAVPLLTGAADDRRTARFDIQPGNYRVQMSIQDSGAAVIDFDVRDLVVRPRTTTMAMGTPQVWRARGASVSADNDPQALPVVTRDFSRADRLLIRVPVYPAGVRVTAQLITEQGELVRSLSVGIGASPLMVYLDVPLATLPDGGYRVELAASVDAGDAQESVSFRVIAQ